MDKFNTPMRETAMNLPTKSDTQPESVAKQVLQSALCYQLLVPHSGNFTPADRTPWGGREIVRQMKGGEERMVGESWEVSAHPSFPNSFTIQDKTVGIQDLEELVGVYLYGSFEKMPIIVKLLNSGSWTPYRAKITELLKKFDQYCLPKEWTKNLSVSCLSRLLDTDNDSLHQRLSFLIRYLQSPFCPKEFLPLFAPLQLLHQQMLTKNLSIQVHPKRGEKEAKSEAWVILDADPHAGIYLGMKSGVTQSSFQDALDKGEDMSSLMHFVKVRPGDVFFIPSGIPHAVGAGVLLLEPQQCSETTYRVYDWDRVVDGKKRPLHMQEAMESILFDQARGQNLVDELKMTPKRVSGGANGLAVVESLVKEPEFFLERITFGEEGDEFVQESSFAAFTVVQGAVRAFIPGQEAVYQFVKGDSFIAAHALPEAIITGAQTGSVLMRTTLLGEKNAS